MPKDADALFLMLRVLSLTLPPILGRVEISKSNRVLQGQFRGGSEWIDMALSDFNQFPGGELIRRGVEDLAEARESVEALLVLIGAPRLRRLGFDIPEVKGIPPEHRLYDVLRRSDPDGAHSRYNALIRRLVRFERAVECAA